VTKKERCQKPYLLLGHNSARHNFGASTGISVSTSRPRLSRIFIREYAKTQATRKNLHRRFSRVTSLHPELTRNFRGDAQRRRDARLINVRRRVRRAGCGRLGARSDPRHLALPETMKSGASDFQHEKLRLLVIVRSHDAPGLPALRRSCYVSTVPDRPVRVVGLGDVNVHEACVRIVSVGLRKTARAGMRVKKRLPLCLAASHHKSTASPLLSE